jgi:hypothetical protein
LFRKQELLPHPNPHRSKMDRAEPKIFQDFPEIKKKIHKFCTNDLQGLSSESLREHIVDELIPEKLEEEHKSREENGEEPIDLTAFLTGLGLTAVCLTTAWNWLKHLGYCYKTKTKCYYSDGHEKPENVEARKEFIAKYLELERRQYVWVQVPEEVATELENDRKDTLLKYISYEFIRDGRTYREYHVDCHPKFINYVSDEHKCYGGDLSVRKPADERPLLSIGQDESTAN